MPIAYAEAMLERSSRALSLLDNSLGRNPESSTIMMSITELSLLNLPFGLERHIKLLGTNTINARLTLLTMNNRYPKKFSEWNCVAAYSYKRLVDFSKVLDRNGSQ